MVGAGLTACLFVYAMPFAFGFANFEFALGLCLFAAAGWIGLAARPLPLRLAVHALAVVVLFFSHLFTLGLYGVTIGIVELWRARRDGVPVTRSALLCLAMAAPVVAVAALAGLGGGAVGGSGTHWHASSKVFWLAMLNGWSREVALALGGVVAIPLCLAFSRGTLRFVGPGAWLAAGFGLLYLCLPFRLLDTGFVDGRALIAAILILPAFTEARAPQRALVTAAIAAALANLAFVAWVQLDARPVHRAVLAALEGMPKGSRLLIAAGDQADDPPADLRRYPIYHLGTLAAQTRDAFVPTLFTHPGKQPIRPRADLAHLAPIEGGPYPMALLEAHAAGIPPEPRFRYVANWTRDFDYALVIHPGPRAPLPEVLVRVAAGERFALYRIRTRQRP